MKSSCRSARLLPITAASFVAMVLIASLSVHADVYWTLPAGQSGDWTVASNWSGVPPTGTDAVYIVNGGTANISIPGAACNSLTLGGTGSGTIQMAAGQLTAKINGSSSGAEYIGSSGRGTFTQSGGTNTASGGLYLGLNAGGSGTYNLNGGMLITSGLGVGSGTAAFNFSGGTLRAGSGFSTATPLTLGAGGGATFDTAGNTVTLSGPLSGAGGLTKIGSGVLSLATANTYRGTTLVSGGTLRLGGNPILLADSLLSTTLNSTNWTTNTSAPVYPAQVIPTISGVELVSRGYLNTAAQYDPTQIGGLRIAGNWKFTGSSGSDLIEIDTRSSGTPDGVYGEVTSGIEFWYYEGNATPTILSRGSNFTIGSVTTSGSLNVHIGDTLSFNSTDNGLHDLSFVLTDLTTNTSASATTTLLSGTATSNFISFHNREVPNDISMLSNVAISRLPASTFLPTTTPLILATSATLDLGGASQQIASLSDNSPGSGGTIINSTAGSASVLTLSATGGSTTFSGLIQGGGTLGTIGLVVSGSGTQVLAGRNTYIGGTTLSGGVLSLGGSGALPLTGTISFTGGTLQATSANTADYSSRFSTATGQIYDIDTNGQTVTWGTGVTSSGGSLTKLGAGMLILTGQNTYSGSTTIGGGTLQLGAGVAGRDGSVTSAITDNSTLVYNLYGNQTIGYAVSGSGNVTKAGTNTLTINTNWTNSGKFNVNSGTLALGRMDIWGIAATYPGVALNLNAGSTVTSNGYFNMLNNLVLNGGTLAGNGGNSTAWGAFGLEGTVTVGGISASYISPAPGSPYNYNFIDLGNQGVSTTTFNVAHVTGNVGPDLIISLPMINSGNAASGAFNLVKSGAGTMLFTASNTYTGSTMIGAGTLQLGTGAAGQDGSVTGAIIDNSALVYDLYGNQTVGYTVSGAGNVTKAGSGMITLSGVNTYSGNTTISAGTLEAIKAASLPGYSSAGKVTIAGGTVLAVQVGDGVTGWSSTQIDSLRTRATWTDNTACLGLDAMNANFTYGTNITQALALTKFGSNTLTLAGSNTYTGDTTIASGILNLGHSLAAQNSTVNVSAGGVLWFAAGITSPTLGGLTGAGSIVLRTSSSQSVTLNVGNNGKSTTYSGSLSGGGGLTKQGAGILTLTASQSYGGSTIINGGMLRLRGVPSVPAGATAVYTFDNATGSLVPNAANRGTYDGTLQNGAAITAFPGAPSGYALSLGAQGGNTYLQVAGASNTGIPTSTGTYTASSWFYGLYGPGTWRTLFRGANSSGDHPVIIDTGSNNLGFYDNVTGSGFNSSGYSTAAYNGAATWHQLTVVASGGTSTYYMDGQAVGTVPRASTTGIFAIGNFQGGGQDFSRYLDDVYIYNGTALNAAGVVQLYNATSGRAASNVLPTTTALSLAASATLDLGGGSQQVGSLSDYGPGSGGSIINSSTGSASVLTLAPVGGTTTYSGLIAGGGDNGPISLVKAGTGTQILAGANTYTGSTTINGGVLQLANQAAVPDNSALSLNAGTLDLGGFTKTTSAAVSFKGGVVQNGVIVNNGPAYDGEAGTLSASLQGSAGLSKTTSGILTLTAKNNYSGLTAINSGTLKLAHPQAVQNSTVNVSPGGTLVFAVGNSNPVLGGLSGVGKVALATAAAEPVALSVGQNGQNTTYSGSLIGAGGLTKQGAGILTLTSPQNYDGPTVIQGGVLQLQPAIGGSIGTHFQGNDNSVVTGSAGVVAMSNWNNLAGTSFTSTALSDNSGLNTTANLTMYAAGLRNSGSSNPLLNGYVENDSYNRLSATIRGIPYANYSLYAYMADYNTNSIGEKVTIGVATYYFNAINSADYNQVTNTNSGKHPKGNYVVATGLAGDTQTVTVQGDTQQYGGFTGFEIVNTAVSGVNLLPSANTLTIGDSATLDLGGTSQQVAALSDYSLASGGGVINSNTVIASVLTLSPTGGSTTFSGEVQGSGALGKISLVMSGSGMQVLSGSNTYTGDTTINSGFLSVDGSLASPVSINGGTLGGTGYLGSVTVNAGGTLAPGDSLDVLHLSGNLVLAAGAKLEYELDSPSSSDRISMPFGNVILNRQQFSDFGFTPSANFGPGSYTLIDFGSRTGNLGTNTTGMVGEYPATLSISGNDLVLNVVPEPSTAALLAAGVLGLIGWAWRRRS